MNDALPVLVIEDEATLLAFYQATLSRGGVKAVGVTSGSEALQLLERGEFAGVVSDMWLAGKIDGRMIYEWVRQNRPALLPRFLFITGDTQSEAVAEMLCIPGVQILEKPFQMEQLLEAIKKLAALEKSYA